jgi:succinate dehydrogenase/fumarate reductase flavoprotein subunit
MNNKFDAIIIDSGLAGLTTALNINNNLKVAIFSKNYITSSNSTQALGGINAVLGKDDNIELFIHDMQHATKKHSNSKAIKFMASNSTKVIQWLDDIGVPFEKENKLRKLDKSSINRAVYASDYTGLKIIQTLLLLDIIRGDIMRLQTVSLQKGYSNPSLSQNFFLSF